MGWLQWLPINLTEWVVFDLAIFVIAGLFIGVNWIFGKKIDGQFAFAMAAGFTVFMCSFGWMMIGALGVALGWRPPMSKW